MKQTNLITFLLSFAILLLSCSSEEFVEKITLDKSQLNVSADGISENVAVTSNVSWTTTYLNDAGTTDLNWITVSPSKGEGNGTISISVSKNGGKARSAEVKVFSSKAEGTVVVYQEAGVEEPDEPGDEPGDDPGSDDSQYTAISKVRALYTGTDYKIAEDITIAGTVISDYRRNTSGGLNNYTSAKAIIVSDGNSGIMLYCAADNTEFARGDKVTVKLKGQTLSVYNGGPLQVNGLPLANIAKIGTETPVAKEITASELVTGAYESTYVAVKDVQVSSDDLAKTFVMSDSHTSIAIEAKTGEMFDIFSSKYAVFGTETVPQGSGTLKGIAGVNNGKYQLSVSDKNDYAGLTNARFVSAPKFALSYTEMNVAGEGSSIKVKLTANVEWTASSSNPDFQLSQSSGNASAEITINYTQNPSTTATRTATITFKTTSSEVANNTITLKITQYAYESLVSDAVNKWIELPKITPADGFAYITHDIDLNGKKVRNYSYWLDGNNRYAQWVAYTLYKGIDASNTSRSDAWNFDPKVPKRCQPVLAKGWGVTGYDRGHQLPSADRLHSVAANESTFYYINMTAQNSSLNQGIWGKLETNVRNWANSCDTLYVVTGAVATTKENTTVEYIKDNSGNNVAIPKAYFKVVLRYKKSDTTNGGYSAVGFWFENKANSDASIATKHAKSVKAIEELTGFDFFHNLDDSIESAVEGSVTTSVWGL